MTPEQLRVRAFKSIETAKLIVENDPGQASYTVGYALEYVLKARFCSKVGLASFPDDRQEAKRLQVLHAFSHDLDHLLKLTDDQGITGGGMRNVDWSVASDWGVERRYEPVGSRIVDSVRFQIVETEKVCIELCQYELLDRLRTLEIEISSERGPFNFFAYWLNADKQRWEVAIAFWSVDEAERAERRALITRKVEGAMDAHLMEGIGAVAYVHPLHPTLETFYVFLRAFGGPIQHAIKAMLIGNMVNGRPPMPPAWVITCANWPEGAAVGRSRELIAKHST